MDSMIHTGFWFISRNLRVPIVYTQLTLTELSHIRGNSEVMDTMSPRSPFDLVGTAQAEVRRYEFSRIRGFRATLKQSQLGNFDVDARFVWMAPSA